MGRRGLQWGVAVLVAVVLMMAGGVLVARQGGEDDRPDSEEEQRRATGALLTQDDLPGSTTGSRPEVEFPTYGKCFGNVPLLGLAGIGRTAAAQAPGFGVDHTTVGAAVVLAQTSADTIAAFDALNDTDVFGCILEAISLLRDRGPQAFGQTETDEVVREPPVGDQSIAFRTARHGPLRQQDSELVVTILRRGRGMAFLLTWSSGATVFPEPERVRLASLMAARLPG